MKVSIYHKIKILIFLFILFNLISPFLVFSGKFGNPQIYWDSLELKVQDLIETYNIPGVAIAIVKKDSIWVGTYGYADREKRIQVSDETIFRLGSISKSFMAIAIMQLVNEGKLDIYDPVKKILPDIEMKNEWEKSFPVRIIHLLEHTSGIDDVHFNEGYNTTGNQEISLENIFAINPGSRNVRWKPGEMFSYSNDAFSLLALIIERITGQKFEEYIQTNILDRIDISSTTYKRTKNNKSLFAQGYTNSNNPLDYTQVLMRPSGGINSNILDLAGFVQMLLNEGFFNDTSVIDSITLNGMLYPSSSIPAKEGYIDGYGSGFSSLFINGQKFSGHGGGLPDFNSFFLFNQDLEVGFVVLINKNSDYFRKIVNTVVTCVNFNKKTNREDFTLIAEKLNPEEIEGYYSQANFGISLDRFPNYFLSGQTVFIDHDTMYIKEFQSDRVELINVNGNLYKKNSAAYEYAYFYKNLDGKLMMTISGKDFYQKDVAWRPVFDRFFLLFSAVVILSFFLFTIIWPVKRFALKSRYEDHLKTTILQRLFPLTAIISLVLCLIMLSIWFKDYNNAGNMTIVSMLVFIFSLLFPLFSLLNFGVCCFIKNIIFRNKLEKMYLILVSSTLIGLSLFLYCYEVIGLRLWAY